MRCTQGCRHVTHLLQKRVESGPTHEAPEDKSLSKEQSDGAGAASEETLEDFHICSTVTFNQGTSAMGLRTGIPSHGPFCTQTHPQRT